MRKLDSKMQISRVILYSTLAWRSISFLANISIHWWPLCSDIGTVTVLPTTSRILSQKEEAISNYFYTMVVWTRTIYIAVNSMIYWSINIFLSEYANRQCGGNLRFLFVQRRWLWFLLARVFYRLLIQKIMKVS